MARSWHYPRWRRYVMQGTMWVVLGATVALAALVNHERRRAMRVELGPGTRYGMLTVRLPQSWEPVPPTAGDARVVVRAVEPGDGPASAAPAPQTTASGNPAPAAPDARSGRMLTVLRERLDGPVTPLEHVLTTPVARGIELVTSYRGRPVEPVEPATVGGWPGVLVRATRPAPRSDTSGAARPRKELYACTVLPSRHALLLKLEGDGLPELADLEVLRQIAAAVEVTPSSQPVLGQAGETIEVDGTVRLVVPEAYRPVYEDDPNRAERRLWSAGDNGASWSAIDLVPCVLAPDDPGNQLDDDDSSAARPAAGAMSGSSGKGAAPVAPGDDPAITQAIRTLLAARDPRLRTAAIEPLGIGAWRIDPQPSTAEAAFPTRGYLLAESDEPPGAPRRALLAVCHGSSGTDAGFEPAWEAIVRSISFVGQSRLGAMFAAGETEVRRLRAVGLGRLVPEAGEQWWLWFDDAEKLNVGWSSVTWRGASGADDAAGATGRRQALWRTPAGQLARASAEWWGNLRDYTSYADAAGDGPSPVPAHPAGQAPGDAADGLTDVRQITTLAGTQLTTEWNDRGRKVGTWRRPAPPQYLPGEWLALVVARLSPDAGPMVLRAESVPGHEGIGPPDPLLLTVTPEPVPAAPRAPVATTAGAHHPPAARRVAIRVNGTGEIARWYVRDDHSIARIDLAGGMQRLPSDLKTVKFTYGHDGTMVP